MAHVHRLTPTVGLEAILDMMLLDMFAQCAAVQAVLRIRGRNQSSWDSIGSGHLRGHLLWGDKILMGVNLRETTQTKEKQRTSFMTGGR